MDVNKFVAADKLSWYTFDVPFALDGRAVATDGNAIICGPAGSGDGFASGTVPQVGIRRILERIEATQLSPLESFHLPEMPTCRTCAGDGRAEYVPCTKCSDTQLSDCPECLGEGVVTMVGPSCPPCPICRGTGRGYSMSQRIDIAGIQVAGRYLMRIMGREGVQVGKVPGMKMLAFRAGEYTGGIMGLRH